MIITIDTNSGDVWKDGVLVSGDKMTIADLMEQHLGAKEYEGIVSDIQKWFYGVVYKTPWCATGLSYFASKAGVSKQVGKYGNVDSMKDFMNSRGCLDCTANYGGGAYTPKRGDVVFMSLKYSYEDCTHVGVVSQVDTKNGVVVVTSCNCDDSIKQKTYNYKTNKYVVAWGRVDY